MTEHLPECPVWRCCKPDERATMHMCICPDDERIGGLITRQMAEQIGRNIGQYGCVITEQRHLPECPMLEPYSADTTQHCFCTRKNPCIHDEMECICDRLRACEQRIKTHEGCADAERIEGYEEGYDAAIAECISLGYGHIDRINEEAEAAISEQVANQLFLNADGIEFLVGELGALQTLREAKQ